MSPKKYQAAGETMLRCDFHCHSFHSDGVKSPEALAAAMQANGVQVFALTDHDTVSGVPAAQAAARQYAGLRCLGGIELSIEWSRGTFHLLGLDLQRLHVLEQALQALQECRLLRNEQILERLRQQGVAIDSDKLQAHCNKRDGEILNRSHIAAYLADLGHCSSYHEAFRRYLAVGASAYVPLRGPSPEEGIEWIHAAGGRAFIAHPHSLRLSWPNFKSYLDVWQNAGLDGLEVSHPRTTLKDHKHLLKLCQPQMEYCGGSDYHHGETKNVLGLGSAARLIEIPQHFSYLVSYLALPT